MLSKQTSRATIPSHLVSVFHPHESKQATTLPTLPHPTANQAQAACNLQQLHN